MIIVKIKNMTKKIEIKIEIKINLNQIIIRYI